MRHADSKPLDDLREGESALEQVKKTSGQLKDYSGQSVVTIHWDMNEDSTKDQIFIIRVNGQEAYLDKQEFLRYLRFV
jgi:hypothetical protein